MKPWWQIVKPHRDIREGRLDEAVFAADLGDVLSQKGPVDYRDPETFFTRTYLPKGLANLLSGITSRLCGKKEVLIILRFCHHLVVQGKCLKAGFS